MALTPEQVESRREYHKRWYQENKEREIARMRAWQKANPEKAKGYQKAWRERNREQERLRAEAKNWRKGRYPAPSRPRPEVCECCGEVGSKALALDHCHATGVFRGWLCGSCNLAIGRLGDSVEGLLRAIDYLKRASQ